ncbi:hypothetical protein C0992_002350 [Termitomyces sp. T32_za158]|nr:hypothetical protein C0992_002350 [Termitomyces sp. T32_za158]
MFVRFPALCMTVALAVCASAASVGVRDGGSGSKAPGNSCDANTGTQQCCDSLAKADDPAVTTLVGLLGIVLGPVDALIGRQY